MAEIVKVECRCDSCKESIEPIEVDNEIPEGWIEIRVNSPEGLIRRKHVCQNCIKKFGGVISIQINGDCSDAKR